MAVLIGLSRRVLTTLCLAALLSIPASGQQVTEQDLKAVFLYKFTNFVEWPASAEHSAEPFRVCTVAAREITAIVERTMKEESVNGRRVQTSSPESTEQARKCEVLFIGRTEMARAQPLLAAVRDLPVLTVGDADRFLAQGGVINFVREENRVRFEINLDNARRAGLTISSRLLRVAAKVEGSSR
jgi:hypothetical protein